MMHSRLRYVQMTKRIYVSPWLGAESVRLADSAGDHVRNDSRVTKYTPNTRSLT